MPILENPIKDLGEERCRDILARRQGGTHYIVEEDSTITGHPDHFYFREKLEAGKTFVDLAALKRKVEFMDMSEDAQKFELFRRYHNDNYHDGDSHFDDRTYRRKENDDTEFEDQFVQDCYEHFCHAWDILHSLAGKKLRKRINRLG